MKVNIIYASIIIQSILFNFKWKYVYNDIHYEKYTSSAICTYYSSNLTSY